jgi:hypothetical protein
MYYKDNAMTYSPVAPNSSLNSASIGNLDRSATFPATPERALEIITSPERPATISLVDWSRMSSVDKLRAAQGVAEPLVQLARAEVVGGRVNIIPETDLRSDIPSFNIPNNVKADGFSPGIWSHDYLVETPAPPSFRGPEGLAAIGVALRDNPTPGQDSPAIGKGALNDVGALITGDGGDNYVRSYFIPSSDPSRSGAIINYTYGDAHTMGEGFVIRYAELLPNGLIQIVTYGEGDAAKIAEGLSGVWEPRVNEAWTQNAREIFSSARELLKP